MQLSIVLFMGVLLAGTRAVYSQSVGDSCSASDWNWSGKADGSADCRTYNKCVEGKVAKLECECGASDPAKCRRYNPVGGHCDWYGHVPCIGTGTTAAATTAATTAAITTVAPTTVAPATTAAGTRG